MTAIIEALKHTPWWVYLVFYILIQRGMAARRPNVAPLWRLALLPGVFGVLDVEALIRHGADNAAALPLWLLAILAGAVFGHRLVRDNAVRADHAQWLIGLEGDTTVLPLALIVFAVKYALAYLMAADPTLAQQTAFLLLSFAIGGFCTGIFVGRVGTYYVKFRQAPSEPLTPSTRGASNRAGRA